MMPSGSDNSLVRYLGEPLPCPRKNSNLRDKRDKRIVFSHRGFNTGINVKILRSIAISLMQILPNRLSRPNS